MNKIWLALLLLPSTLYATDPHESVTPGVLGLLIPTTGYLDTGRRLDDKYNQNYRMISSTVNTLNTSISNSASAVAAATATLTTLIQSTATQLSNYIAANNTSTSTLFTNLNSTAVQLSNYITGNNSSTNTLFTQLNSTASQLSNYITGNNSSTNTLFSQINSTAAQLSNYIAANNTSTSTLRSNLTTFMSTVSNTLSNGPVAVYSGGVFQGNATTLNFTSAITATCSGSTCTPTATASSGGGGSSIRNFDGVVVGTRAALSVDATLVSNADWITILSSFGMAGLTTSTSAQGQIMLRNGAYMNAITTIPAGATILCQSSAVLVMNPLGGRSIFNYGKLGTTEWPCSLDGGALAFTSTQTEFFSNSRGNIIIYGDQSQTAAFGSRIFVVENATGIVANVELKNSGFTDPGSVAYTNDRVPMLVRSSSECVLNFKTGEFVIAGAAGLFSFEDMWHSQINFDARIVGSYYMSHYGGGFNRIGGNARIPSGINEQNPNGFFVFDTIPLGPFYGASTSTVFNMNIESYSTSNGVIVKIISGQSIGISGTIKEHALNNTQTGVSIGASATNCYTDSLYTQGVGTPVTDGGLNSTLNYWVNGKHPFNN